MTAACTPHRQEFLITRVYWRSLNLHNMSDKPFNLFPSIFTDSHYIIRVLPCHEHALTESTLNGFLDTADGCIGVAPAYGSKCVLKVLAFSTPSQVLLVHLSSSTTSKGARKCKKGSKKTVTLPSREFLQNAILCHPERLKFAFKMDKLAISLFLDLGLRISGAVDLLSATNVDRHSTQAIMMALGGEATLHKENVEAVFKQNESATAPLGDIAMQAWIAGRAAKLSFIAPELARLPKINTEILRERHLSFLAKSLRDAHCLDTLKPTRIKNEFKAEFSVKGGNVNVASDRFKTRIRCSQHQTIELQTTTMGKKKIIQGHAVKVEGRAATIRLRDAFQGAAIQAIYTNGKEDPTNAEEQREIILLDALQRSNRMLQLLFVRCIWFPSESPDYVNTASFVRPPISSLFYPHTHRLNPSQRNAVQAIISDDNSDKMVLVQGPPGTGKTSVIACATHCLMKSEPRGRTLWLVAQSNVAVKNIAEKLAETDFLDFKLLVSREFHLDWHEHLYHKIARNLIVSDEFPEDPVGTERRLSGSRVILCTLSMLSNNRLWSFTNVVPVETVIVDEASQIEVGGYIPMLFRYQRKLRKLVFIGDDKQLAPYGQEDLGNLESIFEMTHLRDRALFLNTQYRMPIPLGTFISKHVYANRLRSEHAIKALDCCRFVDCQKGQEKRMGNSFVNAQEMQVVVALARRYSTERKSFRIITPYDGQRSAIENALKTEKIKWEDKCFNVDAFQGNEDDHIIVSLVRSAKIGFLKENRRVNVMLTRCKKSMVICTSRAFLSGIASSSLVAALAEKMGPQAWVESHKARFGTL